jgi:hypothetical protein
MECRVYLAGLDLLDMPPAKSGTPGDLLLSQSICQARKANGATQSVLDLRDIDTPSAGFHQSSA